MNSDTTEPYISKSMRSIRSQKMEIETIISLCKAIKPDKKFNVLEIGVYLGDSTEIFLDSGAVNKLYAIDPWMPDYDINDETSKSNMIEVEKEFDNRITNRFDNAIKHKGTIDSFKDTKFDRIDIVYIDGSHRYEDVLHDIIMTVNHIRPSIAICGHDFYLAQNGIYTIQKALSETIGWPDVILGMASWMKFRNTYSWL